MTDRNIKLTRRKILAATGAIGAAGAGAGMGTTALFTDNESFEGNTLTAGELDLKMDWEEHYSYPQIYDGFGDPTVEDGTDLDVVRDDPDDSRYVGLPDPTNAVVWANDEDDPLGDGQSSLELYFENTTIEAYPDRAGGAVEATFTSIDSGGEPNVENPCSALADVPGDLSTYASDGAPARTKNGDTYDSESEEANPLVNLRDIKPGDFGEFTFSAHLCDNPGYLWMQMPGGLTESENDIVEPEEDVDKTPESGELAENVQTALWYDNDCNNQIQSELDDIVALAVLDTSGSTNDNLDDVLDAADAFVEDLYDATQSYPTLGIQAGVITFEDTGDSNDVVLANPIEPIENYVDGSGNGLFGDSALDIVPDTGSGANSPIPQAMDVGREYLNDKAAALDSASNDIDDPSKELLLVSDGNPVYDTSGGSDSVVGNLLNPDGTTFDFDGTEYESDFFDGLPNDDTVRIPDPSTTDGGTDRAETVLVARDIDGEPFLPGTAYSQPAGPKVDNPDLQGSDPDPADISGDNDITVRTATLYDSTVASSVQQLAIDTMLAIATDVGTNYVLTGNDPAIIGGDIATDLVGGGVGEDVIFRGTLNELEAELSGGLQLRGNPSNGCYSPGVTHCFGLAWWVPDDVGNVIQSDSVSFDLGFYTEQCRNNPEPTGP